MHETEPELMERFLSKVAKTQSCWLWTGAKSGRGYGAFRSPDEKKAHRFSYSRYVGQIPQGLSVCHRCDNPACVNPDHLFVGTHTDNMKDKMSKGRGNHLVGTKHPRSKLTESQVLAIRADNRRQVEIAESYGIKQAQVSEIKRRIAWTHI